MTTTELRTRDDWTLDLDDLARKYAAYIHHYAGRWHRMCPHQSYEDIHGAAALGFVIAYQRYDRSRRLRFTTFATWHMQAQVQKHIRDERNYETGLNADRHNISIEPLLDASGGDIAELSQFDSDPAPNESWRALVRHLDTRSQAILFMRFALDWSLSEVAEAVELSKERVRTITNAALSKLRQRCGRMLASINDGRASA